MLQKDDYSEKDMIGSLLDDDQDLMLTNQTTPSLIRSSSQIVYIQPQVNQQQQQEQLQQQSMYDFPVVQVQQQQSQKQQHQQYYINLKQQLLLQPQRPHSQSYDAGMLNYQQNYYFHPSYIITQTQSPQMIIMHNEFPIQQFELQQQQPKKSFEIEDMISQCKDQYQSLLIQEQFEKSNEAIKENIFRSIENDIPKLSKHRFGNYVIQKIIEKGTQQMRDQVVDKLKQDWVEFCFDKFGCRVIQKLLQSQNMHQNQHGINLFLAVKPKTLALIYDQCGNHVLQRLMDYLPIEQTTYIIEVVECNAENVVSHSYGCRIAQKCLEIYKPQQLNKLYQILTPLIDDLSFCQYGNYIVQQMIQNGPQSTYEKVGQLLHSRLSEVCSDKFASNVAQKYILKSGSAEVELILKELLQSICRKNKLILQLVNDQYGNYVVQHLYQRSNEIDKRKIQDQVECLQEYDLSSYGRYFLQFMGRNQ